MGGNFYVTKGSFKKYIWCDRALTPLNSIYLYNSTYLTLVQNDTVEDFSFKK